MSDQVRSSLLSPSLVTCEYSKNFVHKEVNQNEHAEDDASSRFNQEAERLLRIAQNRVAHFSGGQLRNNFLQWESLTSDREVLNTVSGLSFDFINEPEQRNPPGELKFSAEEERAIDLEIEKFLSRGIISLSSHDPYEFISNIFVRRKRDGSYRMILNLSRLNEHIRAHHFKMENLTTALSLMTKDCYMASLDYKDAYYSVPIACWDQKLLKFTWMGKLYKFLTMPQGLNCAPQKFTKILKPAYARLRGQGHVSVGYIDDSLLIGRNLRECRSNILASFELFNKLGFVIHPTKSVLVPTQRIQFLGFILDSKSMTVSLPADKATRAKLACESLIASNGAGDCSIRKAAEVIGILVACFPAVERGPLFYRHLENDKIKALKEARGNYEGPIKLSVHSIKELEWWIANVDSCGRLISHGQPTLIIECDASNSGWGCCVRGTAIRGGGEWTSDEADAHINYLELKAALFALKSLCKTHHGHVRLMLDNTTAVAYIREMGGSHSMKCNAIAYEIWQWAIARDIWLSACHIPGIANVVADRESRVFHRETEWKLNAQIFRDVITHLKILPSIDLFASRSNFQLKPYISWRPDPDAVHIDAFTFCWTNETFYAFPPFSVLPRVIKKIREDRATGLLIAPKWPTQPWYPSLMQMLVCKPFIARRSRNLLHLPNHPDLIHPMHKHLELLCCVVSGTH